MTSVLHRSHAAAQSMWSGMPGWSIVADLTPPELRARRSLGMLRRAIAGGLVLVVLLCIVGYIMAARTARSAQTDLDTANAQSATIQSEIAKHSQVTEIESATSGLRSQLATLLASDVDVSRFIQLLIDDLPAGMSLTSVNVTMTPSGAVSDPTSSSSSGVGTVTLAGKSSGLTDLAQYASTLTGQLGIVGVLPTSNSTGDGGGAWTLTLNVTAKRYSHRYGTATTAPASGTTSVPSTPTTTGGN